MADVASTAKPKPAASNVSVARSVTAKTTTTALSQRVRTLNQTLDEERAARLLAEEQLKQTVAELEALERVLFLRRDATRP